MIKTGLGKGLSALIPMEPDELTKDEPVAEIEISLIQPNPYQPRRQFNEQKLEELANSIREHGVVQPIMVRPLLNGKYELVVGERRFRACQKISLEKIPAVIKELSNEQMMEIALVENIQRQDLNPVEEAKAYKRLIEEFRLTQEQVAQRVSKSRPLIANMIRLLNLPTGILENVTQGKLTIGHVRPLLSIHSENLQIQVAQEMMEKELSVREAEVLVKNIVEKKNQPKTVTDKETEKKVKLPPTIIDIESKLRSKCGTKVKIKDMGDKGKIEIEYYSLDDLERIIDVLLKEETE